ncbi:MAG: hypothetical protein ACTHMM_16680 [Agriterribacter sp.]
MSQVMLNQQQQQAFGIELNKELTKATISWSNELRQWHKYAIDALEHASLVEMQVRPEFYPQLFETTDMGINANVVAVLANNLEARKPSEMRLSAYEWVHVMALNKKIADSWEAIAAPLRKTVLKRVQLMGNGGNKILKPVIAEA